MVTFGKIADRKEYALMEPGEYCLTLLELDEVEGQYGDRVVWKFLVAPLHDPTAYYCRDDGQEKSLWSFTDPDIIVGSLAHQLAEALTGRKLSRDSEPPTEEDLVGKRLISYVGHETPKTGKSAGIKREAIMAGTIKPFRMPAPKNGNGKAVNVAVPPMNDDEGDREVIVATLKKRVARLQKLDAENGQKAQEALEASELDTAPLADLERLSDAVQESITAALDA